MNKLFLLYLLCFFNTTDYPFLNIFNIEKNVSDEKQLTVELLTKPNKTSTISIHSDLYSEKDITGLNIGNNFYTGEIISGNNFLNSFPGSLDHNKSEIIDLSANELSGNDLFQNTGNETSENLFAENGMMAYSNSLLKKLNFINFPQPENSAPPIDDIQTIKFLFPETEDTLAIGTTIIPQVSFTNLGTRTRTNVPVVYKITDSNGNKIYNQSAEIDLIRTFDTITVNFPESSALTTAGNYAIRSYSELDEDQDRDNDTITGSITITSILNDIQPAAFLMPLPGDTLDYGSKIIPGVTFLNNGFSQLTNVPVRYRITDSTGIEVYNQSYAIPSIESGETVNVTFPQSDSFSVSGIYTINAISELPGDQVASNDSLYGSIIISPYQGDPDFTINWIDRPVNFQLFARESDDSGIVSVQGVINNNGAYYDTCLTRLYKNGSLIRTTYQLLSYAGNNAVISLTDKIKAERSEYKITFSLRKPSGSGDTLLYTADSLVAGDTYLINGQSNVYFAPTDGGLLNFKSEYIRTFGIQTDSLNYKTYNPKDTTWGKSDSYFTIATLTEGHPRNVGGIGQFLQRYILDTFNIPTCFINGSVNNTSIKTHTRNNSYPAALNTLYGKLLYRTQKAKLQNKIKAIIWFQGETDNSYAYSSPGLFNPRGITDPYGYPAYFDSLYKGWVADYDFEKVYVFQIRQVACSYQNRQSVFREVQRQLQTTYHDTVQVIPTVGIGNRADDNCHYKASGYDQLAHNLFRRLRQDFYSITDSVDMRPPNIVKAFYSSFDKKQIGMIFSGSKPGSIPADSLNRNIKNYFYLNNVRTSTASSLSLSLSKDTLTLTMPESQNASYLKYLPNQDSTNIYNGPFIRNSKGIAALTFDSVYIQPYSGLPQNDIQPFVFLNPVSGDTLSYGTTLIPQVSFKNNGINSQTNVPVKYEIRDSTCNKIYSDSALIPVIVPGEILTVTFPESNALTSAGNYTISSYCELSGDQITSNDSITGSITVAPLMDDIQIAGFISPISGDTLAFGSVISPQVSLTNNGMSEQTNVNVFYKITDSAGVEIYSDSAVIAAIDASDTLTVTFPESNVLTTAGNYTISSYCELSGDQITGNDSITGSITVAPLMDDIQIAGFISPISGDTLAFGSVISPQVSFTNNGMSEQTNVNVFYKITDSAGVEIYNDSAVIAAIDASDTLTVTFPESNVLTTAGNYTISSYCELSGDQITGNDSITGSITVAPLMDDIQIAGFISPISGDTLAFGSVISPQVSFSNNGSNPQSNVSVRYKITDSAGVEIYSDSAVIAAIDASDTLTVTFPESNVLTTAGNYTISSYCELSGDQITGNDSITGSITISLQTTKFIELKFYLEVMYPKFDTVKVYLANSVSPFQIIDSSIVYSHCDDNNFTAIPSFTNILSANSYYIVIRHRNSIEVWSANPVVFTSDTISYNFTTSAEMTYGNNSKLVGNNYCIYSGDENQDGVVDLSDISDVSNSANTFLLGYERSDMNGDNVTDLEDVVITSNSAGAFVVKIVP